MDSQLREVAEENIKLRMYIMKNTQAAAAVPTTAVGAASRAVHAEQVAA